MILVTAIRGTMISSSGRLILPADHSKFQTDHFARFGWLTELDIVVTDDRLDDEPAAELAGTGPQVVCA